MHAAEPVEVSEAQSGAVGEALQIGRLLGRVRGELISAAARAEVLVRHAEVQEDLDRLRQVLHLQARLDALRAQVVGTEDVLEGLLALLRPALHRPSPQQEQPRRPLRGGSG